MFYLKMHNANQKNYLDMQFEQISLYYLYLSFKIKFKKFCTNNLK